MFFGHGLRDILDIFHGIPKKTMFGSPEVKNGTNSSNRSGIMYHEMVIWNQVTWVQLFKQLVMISN